MGGTAVNSPVSVAEYGPLKMKNFKSIAISLYLGIAAIGMMAKPANAIPTTYMITPTTTGGFSGFFVVDIDGSSSVTSATSFSFTDSLLAVFGTISDTDSIFINNITRDGSAFGISAFTIFAQGPLSPAGMSVINRAPLFEGSLVGHSNNGNSNGTISKVAAAAPVPEPSAMALVALGLVGLATIRRRQKAQRVSFQPASLATI